MNHKALSPVLGTSMVIIFILLDPHSYGVKGIKEN